MAKLCIALVAALLGIALYFALRVDGAPPAPGTGDELDARRTEGPPPLPVPAERRQLVDREHEPPRQDPEPPPPEPEAGPPTPPEPAPQCTLQLRVFDVITRAPVPAFRYDWRQGSVRRVDRIDGHAADLPATAGAGELLVEADGYQPERRQALTVPTGLPSMLLELQLAPVARESGIELTVRDPHAMPVAHLRVDAWRLSDPGTPVAEAAETPTAPPQWARRARESQGVYRLPDLDPGNWLVRVQALEDDGTHRTLQPALRRITFFGSEHLPVTIDLVDGALVTVEVVDVTGNDLGMQVSLRLMAGAEETPVDWVADLDGQTLRRRGGLPGAAPATMAHPVPPGNYQLQVSQDGMSRPVLVELRLHAGQHHRSASCSHRRDDRPGEIRR